MSPAKPAARKAIKKAEKKPAPKAAPANLVHVVGYGTFITRRTFERYHNLELCKVTGFKRVYPPRSGYPFAIPASEKDGFWALLFDIPEDELPSFDNYEGAPILYERKTVSIQRKASQSISAEIYIASKKEIQDAQLSTTMDPTDRWRDVIKAKVPDLLEKFPELAEKIN